MRIERDSFSIKFSKSEIPNWVCSTCKKGKVFFKKDNLSIFETKDSIYDFTQEYWEAYLIDKYFNVSIACNNPNCNEIYIISGIIRLEEEFINENELENIEMYFPEYIYPVLNIFEISDNTPIDVQSSILKAFKVFWIDKSACGNAIRTAIEEILNDKKIYKTELLPKKKKRRKLSLHERIELFKEKNHEVANYLMAIKWIGNAGSHSGDLTNDDILDGFELLKYSLEKLYSNHGIEIEKMSKIINKKRKPLN